jgi:hypothetical protein
MSGRILRRCTVCKRFHASYLVQDAEFGKCYLCYACWKARHAGLPPSAPGKSVEHSGEQAETGQSMSSNVTLPNG